MKTKRDGPDYSAKESANRFDDMKDDPIEPPAVSTKDRFAHLREFMSPKEIEHLAKNRGMTNTPELNKRKNAKRGVQVGRMLRLACDSCDWVCRATQKRIDQITNPTCPACCRGKLVAEGSKP